MLVTRLVWRRVSACVAVLLLAHATWWSTFALCDVVAGAFAPPPSDARQGSHSAPSAVGSVAHGGPRAHAHHEAVPATSPAPESTRTPTAPAESHTGCPMAMTCALAALPLPITTLALPTNLIAVRIDDAAWSAPTHARVAPEPPPPRG